MLMARAAMVYSFVACIVMAHAAMARVAMAYAGMAYMYVFMAYLVIACLVMVHVVMAKKTTRKASSGSGYMPPNICTRVHTLALRCIIVMMYIMILYYYELL